MGLDPHLAYSIRSRGESWVWGKGGGGLQLTDRALLSLSLVPGRRRTGCRGSLRRLWSSWYASLSAPLSTPLPRATPSAVSGRSARGARWSEVKPAINFRSFHRSFPHCCIPIWLIPHHYLRKNISLHLVSLVIVATC